MNKERKWTSGPNDPGILRKKDDGTDTELLVFGYACKLFRDDQRASEIDRGTHLINWMGQESLKIDRYDARGHLNDLIAYETSESYVLTPEEKRIEQLCDEERYRALYSNEEENQLYQEEEYKRLRQALNQDNEYGQVAYSYNEKGSEDVQPEPESADQQEEQFIPDPMLEIPFGMDVPDTNKQHMIIEKTAFMVDSHGSQMEFLLKVKQGSNAKFSFLHSTDRLNPYYNYIRKLIKARKYKPQISSSSDQPQTSYLHPSLITTPHVEAAPSITTIPSIAYKPSADCAYNQLVNKIRTVQKSQELAEPHEPVPTAKETVLPPPKVVKVIDSLFQYCNRNGLNINEFANRLPQSDENMKFRFSDNPYHSYWITRLMEAQESSLTHEDANHSEKSKVQDSSIPSNEIDDNDENSSSNTGFSLNPTQLYEDESSSSSGGSEQQPMEIRSSEITKAEEKYTHTNGNLPTTLENTLAQPNVLNTLSVGYFPTVAEPVITSTTHFSSVSNNSLQPKPSKPAPVSFSIKNKKDEKLEISSALPLESSDSEGGDEAEVEAKLDSAIEKDSCSSKFETAPLTSTVVNSVPKESEKHTTAKKKVKSPHKDSGDQSTTKRKIKSRKNSPSEVRKKRHKKNDSSKVRESKNSPLRSRKEQKNYILDSKLQDYAHKNSSSNSNKVQQMNKFEPKSLEDFSPPEHPSLPKELVSPSREKSADQLMKMEQRRKRLKEFKMKMAAQGIEDLKTDSCGEVKRIPLNSIGDNDTTFGPHLELVDGQVTSKDESNVYETQLSDDHHIVKCSLPPVVPEPYSEKLVDTVEEETSFSIQMAKVSESNGATLTSLEDLPGPSRTLTSNFLRRTVDIFRDETGGYTHQKLKKHKKKKRKSEKKASMKKSKKKKKKYGHSPEQKYDPTLSESSSSEIDEGDDSSSSSSISAEEEQSRREKRKHKGKKRKSSKRSHKKQSHRSYEA